MAYGKMAVGVALGAAVASSPALAQDARKLEFGLRAQVEHHSNVSLTNEAQAALRGLVMADTIFTPTASVDIRQPVGRQALFLRGSVGYAFYDKNTDLNRERLDITGGVDGRLGPCAVTLTGGYARGVERVDDPTLIENARNIQDVKRAAVDVGCSRPTGFGIVGSASKEWVSNDLPLSKLSDSELQSVMMGVSYSRPALGVLTVFGNYQDVKYPNRLIDDGYDLNAFGVSFERQLGARIQGSATVAYTSVDLHAPSPPGFSSSNLKTTTYSASLTYRASNRLRFQGLFDRAVTPSSGFGRTYDLSNTYQLTGDYDLGSRIGINVGVVRVERDSEGGLALPGLQLTNSTTDAVFGTVKYKQSERLTFNLTAGREERTTNAPQFDYTNERIGVGVEASF